MTTTTSSLIENIDQTTQNIDFSDIIDMVNHLANLNLGYLGIAVTILVLFGGAFYLFNFKPLKEGLEEQKNTLDELEKEVNKNLSSSKKEIKSDQDLFKKEQVKTLSDITKQNNEKILSDIKTKLVTFENIFTEKFNSFAEKKDENLKTIILSEINDKIRELEKSINKEINDLKLATEKEAKATQNSISGLKSDLKNSNRKIRELEVYKYSKEGKMGAIYGSIDLLGEAIDDDSWEIERSLDRVEREIDGYILESETITRIEEQLIKLDKEPKYSILLKKIRAHYDKKDSE